jgi:S1-C subfamily serine protease
MLYKDTGDKTEMDPDPSGCNQQILDIAIQLASTGCRLIKQSENPPPPLADPWMEDLEALITDTTVRITTAESNWGGSGVITEIRGKKYVLTANHCISATGSRWLYISTLGNDSWWQLNQSVGWNDGFDVTAFPLPETFAHLPAVPLLTSEVPVGEMVYLSSFPWGRYCLTSGRVREYCKERTELIHSANSAGGSSGGMLITSQGYLCGVHAGRILSAEPYCLQKVAIPSSLIMRLAERYDW